MTISVKQLHPLFVGEITGVDLRKPVDENTVARIEEALNAYSVLVFPLQDISDDQQIAFSEWLGPLETSMRKIRAESKQRLDERLADISNLDEEGRILPRDDKRRMHALGNHLWHTDSSFKINPSKCSLLSARVVPSFGGELEFADTRAAYDALPEKTKREIEPLIVEHSIFHSRSILGYTDFTESERTQLPSVQWPLVRVHPGSKRTALYIAAHASHIIGRPLAEGRMLLLDLINHATQPQFVYRHRMRPGDLVCWDNRCTMHRDRPFDDLNEQGDFRRTTVSDISPPAPSRSAAKALDGQAGE